MPFKFATIAMLAVALAAAWGMGTLCANDAIPSAAAGVPETPHPPRMLILYDGKVVQGAIRFAQGGYEVASQGGGRVFFANELVWFGTDSAPEAYEQLRQRLPDQTANGHTALAAWCVENGLFRQAEGELKLALQLEPDHAKARETLKTLDALLHPASPTPTPPVTSRISGEKPKPAAIDPSLSTMQHFVTRIQPILVNSCGNAACHGTTSGNIFTIKNVRAGNPAHRAFTEHNLNATKAFIALDRPEASSLIVAPQQPGHGGSHRPVFGGPSGASHQKILSAWVAAMAETMPRTQPTSIATDHTSQSILQVGSATNIPGEGATVVVPASEPNRAPDPTSDLLQRVLAEERPDAFDPEKFNRQFAPRSSEPSPSSFDGPTR